MPVMINQVSCFHILSPAVFSVGFFRCLLIKRQRCYDSFFYMYVAVRANI